MVPLEEYLQCKLLIDTDQIVFSAPPKFADLGCGTPPIRHQPTLLVYLLAYHNRHKSIIDVIEGYVQQVRPGLTELDFKKTKTGVTRCFTNTRFAANILRGYGFLKFTKKEAFKSWVLSLPGFIVASKVIDSCDWGLHVVRHEEEHRLHPSIRTAWDSFDGYDKFYNQLVSVCYPNREFFRTFSVVLKKAYSILSEYWAVLNAAEIKEIERKQKSIALLKILEKLPGMDRFYDEFSTSVNVNRFLEQVKKVAGRAPESSTDLN